MSSPASPAADTASAAPGGPSGADSSVPRYRDPGAPVGERVEDLLARMTPEEKVAQLVAVWVGVDAAAGDVAPLQSENAHPDVDLEAATRHGLGQLTRLLGTRPVPAREGSRSLARFQQRLVTRTRLGIPALAHEECLVGVLAHGATTFPNPTALAAAWDPSIARETARAIGASMRAVGAHQGLAPVLDVARDARWGRVEETFGEDPYLVGTHGAAYVAGLESAGIVATLKHFVGYSASRGGRNLGSVGIGPRELADVMLVPFEHALREGGARSVMHSYADLDGVPAAADEALLTGLLRDRWGFAGVLVADYHGVRFLRTLHGVAATDGAAAVAALRAGVDVDLPNGDCYGEPLLGELAEGRCPPELVDRAVRRVLRQKIELGLLEATFDPEAVPAIDLDPPEHRELAARAAREAVTLLSNPGGLLPLAPGLARVAVVGPNADDPRALQGDYSFANHVEPLFPGTPPGIAVPTVLDAVRAELRDAVVVHARGCDVRDGDRSGIAAAAELAAGSEACVLVLGDRAGLFGRGTVGEGCDAADLELPGAQRELAEAVLATGTPVVAVLLTGRPYALGWLRDAGAAVVAAWMPGEEGAAAVAGVLSGRLDPRGRTPLTWPASSGVQPYSYLHTPILDSDAISAMRTEPVWCFGHGLTWTTFRYDDLALSPDRTGTDGVVRVGCAVTNTGERAGSEVVQLYARDPVASVTRPVQELVGYAKLRLEPGESARVTFVVAADRFSFTGRDLARRVEPGEIVLSVGASVRDLRLTGSVHLDGPVREVGHDRVLTTPVTVSRG